MLLSKLAIPLVALSSLVGMAATSCADIISFSNPMPIVIRDNQPALPYPSTITVSGINAPIENITVSLNSVSHRYPNDMAAVVVSPTGSSVLLFSGPGSNLLAANLNFVFDDNAAATLPQDGALSSGTYRPGLEQYDENFPAPGPGGKVLDSDPAPWAFSFSSLFNENPNGDWNLFVIDGQPADVGTIAGGWGISFQVAAVPEPSTSGMGLLLAGALWRRRSQNRTRP